MAYYYTCSGIGKSPVLQLLRRVA